MMAADEKHRAMVFVGCYTQAHFWPSPPPGPDLNLLTLLCPKKGPGMVVLSTIDQPVMESHVRDDPQVPNCLHDRLRDGSILPNLLLELISNSTHIRPRPPSRPINSTQLNSNPPLTPDP
jgi:hypothetical protein